ncbi:hypothetical protein Tco_0728439 [Tanacetum coccineum]|uniref:Uncharacterized protein n=1 Tax=Tanacetum coccineum TaxID=301880 RepID=A0ABQ4YP70_9ASTR
MLSPSREDDSYEKIDCQMASPPDSEIVSLEVVEIVIPEVGGIDDILLTIKDDILREKLLNINLLIAKLEAYKENSSGSTTTRFDYSLPDYEAFYSDDDHIKEKSSGSTTTHADFSQYDSFIFDLSINPFPPADRSDFYHEEFAGELAHIISPLEYDCFCFKIEPELGNFTMDVVEDIFPTREPRIHVLNVLPTHPTLNLDLDFILSSESLFAYVVWIFGCGGGGSVEVVSVVVVKLEGTQADVVIALKKHLSAAKQDLIICRSGWCHSRILEANPLLILIILKTFECLWLHTLHAIAAGRMTSNRSYGQCPSVYIRSCTLSSRNTTHPLLLHLFLDEMMSDVHVFRPGSVGSLVAASAIAPLVGHNTEDVIVCKSHFTR